MAKLLPILLALLGIGAGVAAGVFFQKPVEKAEIMAPCGDTHADSSMEDDATDEADMADVEYIKLNNQFVIPVVINSKISSMVVLALSVEIESGRSEEVYSREPKMRDAFLQILFDHANNGGFNGSFTSSSNLDVLRRALRETSRNLFGNLVRDVLITDIARQDV